MSASKHDSPHQRWAHLRFSVIGQLLAAPPPKGALRAEIKALAARTWQHPISGEPVRFGASTIERWLIRARRERRDPVAVLRRKVRADAGIQQVSTAIREVLRIQYAAHPSWSVYWQACQYALQPGCSWHCVVSACTAWVDRLGKRPMSRRTWLRSACTGSAARLAA